MKKYDWFCTDEVKLKMPEKRREPRYFIEFKSRDSKEDRWTHLHNYYYVEDAVNDLPRLEKQNPDFIYRVSKKMTLRCTIEIVPFGNEELKKEIFRLNISNVETIRNKGFGNEICKYRVTLQGRVLEFFEPEPGEEWETIDMNWIEEHNRRDGAIALVAKACKLMEEKA